MASEIDLKIVFSKFKLAKKIDEGAFGKIYKAIDIRKTAPQFNEVAVKIQPLKTNNFQLLYECKIYSCFLSDPDYHLKGIPSVYQCGVQDDYNMLVMDLMGPSLQSLFEKHRRFSLKTVLMLLDQMISRIEYVHSRCIIHRDIKPDNFCMGHRQNSNKLYILDFGLAKKYMREGKHIPYRQGKSLTGTARYASVNTHLGYEQSRRDDLEGIAYVGIYLLKGSLPWQGLRGRTKQEKYLRIKERKIRISIDELCKNCPEEFNTFLSMIRILKFQEMPEYRRMQQLFQALFKRQGFKYDYQYDWNVKNAQKDLSVN